MNYVKIGAAVLSSLSVLFILLAVQGEKTHDFDGMCTTCHVGLKDPSVLTRDPNYLCLRCHPDNVKRSHPSDFIPIKDIPPPIPVV